jgi:hypothetical protein
MAWLEGSDMQITKNALVKRANRNLAHENERLRFNRRTGDYMRYDLLKNAVIDTAVNLVELGKELGVLRPGETVR